MNDTIVEQRLHTTYPGSPPLRPPTFPSADVAYVVEDTPVGRILFARNGNGALVASRYVVDDEAADAVLDRLAHIVSPRVLRLPTALDEARRQFEEFLAGRRHDFDLETDLALATPFQRDVLETLAQTVGYGERETYARSTGPPRRGRSAPRSGRTRSASSSRATGSSARTDRLPGMPVASPPRSISSAWSPIRLPSSVYSQP